MPKKKKAKQEAAPAPKPAKKPKYEKSYSPWPAVLGMVLTVVLSGASMAGVHTYQTYRDEMLANQRSAYEQAQLEPHPPAKSSVSGTGGCCRLYRARAGPRDAARRTRGTFPRSHAGPVFCALPDAAGHPDKGPQYAQRSGGEPDARAGRTAGDHQARGGAVELWRWTAVAGDDDCAVK